MWSPKVIEQIILLIAAISGSEAACSNSRNGAISCPSGSFPSSSMAATLNSASGVGDCTGCSRRGLGRQAACKRISYGTGLGANFEYAVGWVNGNNYAMCQVVSMRRDCPC